MTYDPGRPQTMSQAVGRDIDAGLQAHMRSVYNTMTWGLGVTGLTAFAVAHTPALLNLVMTGPMYYVFAFAPLVFLWFGLTPNKMLRMPSSKAFGMFLGFCVLMGVSFSTIFAYYSGESIARVFFITAATFLTMSLYGYTTKKQLDGMASFLMMGFTGIFIAMIVNIFLGSAMLNFIVSVLGVVIFTGLTAWETQVVKETYAIGHGRETNQKLAIIGALSLYMSFINLFMFLMSLMGRRD
jgi:FtsH-binding integral membrane protein